MFGTVIIDTYKKSEVKEIADALEDLCSPNDNYGWSSAGVYCFWDYYTKEVYYIGLAADLYERFMQHNGLLHVSDDCCKKNQIDEYFSTKEKLGYSIFVQSSLSQPITHRNKKQYEDYINDINFSKEDYAGKEGLDHIRQVEGILIEAYRKINNKIPKWNKMNGSVYGQNVAKEGNYEIVKAFNNFNSHPLTSKYSLRELSANPTYERYENFLHAVRMSMLTSGMSYGNALEFHRKYDIINTYEDMVKDGYYIRVLNV